MRAPPPLEQREQRNRRLMGSSLQNSDKINWETPIIDALCKFDGDYVELLSAANYYIVLWVLTKAVVDNNYPLHNQFHENYERTIIFTLDFIPLELYW
jgi:hypothetical protein